MLNENHLFMIIGTDAAGAYSTAIVGAKTLEAAEVAFKRKNPELNLYGSLSMVDLRAMLSVMEKVSCGERLDAHEIPPGGIIIDADPVL